MAERKVKSLLSCDAAVKVFSPDITPELSKLHEQGRINWMARAYEKGDIQGAFLVIAATDDPLVQSLVFFEAEENNILVNVADVPEKCNFILPAVVKRGDFSLAVSTGGKSPALARKTRQQLEEQFGAEYGQMVEMLGALRSQVLAQKRPQADNKLIFEKILDDRMIGWFKENDWLAIEDHIREVLGADMDLQWFAHFKEQFAHKAAGSIQQ